MRNALLLALGTFVLTLTACAHKKHAAIPPPPPPPATPQARPTPQASPQPVSAPIGEAETGIASWYGHPYHGRQAADGEIYDMETLVAAHRTLPFNTWVRVVNLRNNRAVEVRIIDRGPFIEGRIIDLSHAAAQAIDLIGPGIGPVRLEVISSPISASARKPSSPPPAALPARSTTALAAATPPAPRITPPPPVPTPSPVVPPVANSSPAVETSNAAFAVQVGIYLGRTEAERIRAGMAARYGTARLVRREGEHEMWRVLVGSESTENAATAISDRIRQESGERNTFVVRLDSY